MVERDDCFRLVVRDVTHIPKAVHWPIKTRLSAQLTFWPGFADRC